MVRGGGTRSGGGGYRETGGSRGAAGTTGRATRTDPSTPNQRSTTNRVAAARAVASAREREAVKLPRAAKGGTHGGGSHATGASGAATSNRTTRARDTTTASTSKSDSPAQMDRSHKPLETEGKKAVVQQAETHGAGSHSRSRAATTTAASPIYGQSRKTSSSRGAGSRPPVNNTRATNGTVNDPPTPPRGKPQVTPPSTNHRTTTHGGGSHSTSTRHAQTRNTPTERRREPASRSFLGHSQSAVSRDLEEPLLSSPRREPRQNHDDMDEAVDGCQNCGFRFCSCAGCLCAWVWGCCLGFLFGCCRGRRHHDPIVHDEEDRVDEHHPSDNNLCKECISGSCRFLVYAGSCCGSTLLSHRSILPVFLFTILLVVLTVTKTGQTQTWTLNAGESVQVIPGWFTNRVDIQVTSAKHDGSVEVSVYALQKKCPSLTGPVVSTYHEHTMSFGPLDYQYDFFYLNQNTKLDAAFTQTQGFSDVYLLRGQDALSTLQGHHDEKDWSELLRKALKKWEIDMEEEVDGDSFGTFKIDKSDVYTLLYDNPSTNSNGQLFVDLWLDMTTYNLKGYAPTCSDLAFQRCRPIETEFAKCIIVDTWKNGDDNVTTIKVVAQRDWTFIIGFSFLPGFLFVVWKLITCCGRTGRHGSRRNVAPAEGEIERPPPVAPRTPSAPPAADDLH